MTKLFTDIVSAQGWNDETQLIHALGFIEMRGLHDDFTAYAQACADEENAEDAKLVARHLHESGADRTLCGLLRLKGERSGWSVHVTKARRTDCQECREAFRAQVRDRSRRSYATKAEQAGA